MKISFVKHVAEGRKFPPFYGLSHYEYETRDVICYPVPFNHLVRLMRDVWIWVRNPGVTRRNSYELRLYMKGVEEGKKYYRTHLDKIEKALSNHERHIIYTKAYKKGWDDHTAAIEKAFKETFPSSPEASK